MILLIIIFGLLTILIGRWVFAQWFNHVSLYSGAWSLSLFLFELRLINYYPLEIETWFIIFGGWVSFIIGAITVVVARKDLLTINQCQNPEVFLVPVEEEIKILKKILIILNIISLLVVLQHWYVVIKMFGSVKNVFIWANILRNLFVQGEITGMVPYISSLSLTNCVFAGLYTMATGKLKLVVIISLLLVVLLDIAAMGRARIILSMILFLSGYLLGKKRRTYEYVASIRKKIWKSVKILLILFVFFLGIEIVRDFRAVTEYFPGETKSLQKLKGSAFITPSIYVYLTVSNGVLNQYYKYQMQKKVFAGFTLGPFWRALSKIGFDTYVSPYPPFYYTPVPANTSTYLGELYSDFGVLGVFCIPYLIGLISSLQWLRLNRTKSLVDVILLSHLFVIIIMSFTYMWTSGYWLFSIFFGLIIAYMLDKRIMIKKYKYL